MLSIGTLYYYVGLNIIIDTLLSIGLSALGTPEPQGQASSLPSVWFNRTEVAHSTVECPPVTDNHYGAGAKVTTGCGR